MTETENQQKGILVVDGGMLTLLQDIGRFNYRKYGMPTAGAMDEFSHRVGNLLVGNPEGCATMEITILGPELVFLQDTLVAVTGAPMKPRLNGQQAPMWQSIPIRSGDRLTFGGLQQGCRAYLSVMGGYNVPKVMGSYSTYMRAGIGGYRGRQLKNGDLIPLDRDSVDIKNTSSYYFPGHLVPEFASDVLVRVVMGPQQDYFSAESLRTFLKSSYRVDSSSDRMGYRLNGPKLQHLDKAEIISDGMIPGSVQVPGHGNPIVMMLDCATTGGYPKIATVISADLPKVAQLKPGDKIAFKKVSLKAAQRAYRLFKQSISQELLQKKPEKGHIYHVSIEGRSFRVRIKKDAR